MSATQGAMTDLSSANSTYLSTSVEEPELGSIDFRQSLRFFQEQLINSKTFTSPTINRLTNEENKFSINFTDEKHLYAAKNVPFQEGHRSLSNCRISIPTVDTILESVRVLRAIQKSQEQRGSSWSLNVTNSDTEASLQYLHLLANSGNKDKNGPISECILEETSPMFQDDGVQDDELDTRSDKCTVNGHLSTAQNASIKSKDVPSFWPRSSIKQDIPKSATEKIIEDIEAPNNTKENSANGDVASQSNFNLLIEIEDTQNTDLNEFGHRIEDKPRPGKNKEPIILNGCNNFLETDEAHSRTKLSQKIQDLQTKTTPHDSLKDDSKPDSNSENPQIPSTAEVASFLEESTSEISKLNSNFPDISRIYRISWDSIDSTSATNSSLGEESSNKDSMTDSSCMESSQTNKPGKEKFEQTEKNSKRENEEKENLKSENKSLENEVLQKTPDPETQIFKSSVNFSPTNSEHLRPGSVSDTCSSLYVSAECSPCQSFYETSDENDAAYSNLNVDNEGKEDVCMEDWTTESSEQNQIRINESTSSKSNSNILSNNPIIQETTLTNLILDTTDNKDIFQQHLQLDKETNPSTVESNFNINSHSISQAVSEINNELLNLKLKCTDASNVSNLDSSQAFLNAIKNSESNAELTDTSNENRSCEAVKCSTKTLKLSKGNKVEKNIAEEKDDPEKESSFEKTLKSEEANEVYGVKKLTTSSWKLEAIMDSLYTLPKCSTKASQAEIFQGEAFIMSQGAFCNYSEGNYTVTIEQQILQITQESESNDLLTIPLNYGEVSFADRTTLKLDNRLGRCLFFKFTTHEELLELKEVLKIHCMTQWESECINLIHYPLKCHQNTVIVDLGSCSTRAGILMDEPTLPFIFFPSVCATDKTTGNHVYGKEALQAEVRQNSSLSFPIRPSIKIIKHSIDIGLVEGLFKKIFYDLRVDPTQYTIQVCLPRSLSISAQNALVKLLLENFKVQSVSLTHQALLTLYAHNVSTGIVVDVGERMDILPVVDGFIVENGVTRLPYGGQRLIHHMKHALAEKHISLSNDIDAFVVQYITENLAYIAENYEDEINIATQYPDVVRKSIALQTFAKDNNWVEYATLEDARFKIPEGLFKPELWGLDNPGIHKLVQKAIQATSMDVRKKIAENIYVSGGVTLTPGFVERLFKEIAHLNKPRITPKVIASNYRYHCTYIGACKFAKMDVFPKVCVNMEDYSKNQLSSLKKFVLCF